MEQKDNVQQLAGMTIKQLQEVVVKCGMPSFAARQMAQWLYEKRVCTVDEMTNLSLRARTYLRDAGYNVGRTSPKGKAQSVDGTVKYLFEGVGGHDIEAVYIPDQKRATLCVSVQAGCKMSCLFCMTGRQGFHGNLSTAAIMNQILSIPESNTLSNVVFMGMGEPLDNLDAVLGAIEIITAPWGMSWSPKRITVSSIGKLEELRRLLDNTSVHVAISMHSPFSSERKQLMPVEQAYPITDVISLLRRYDFAHQRRLSMEYIMWHGLNDDMLHADAVARLLHGVNARVNLIRFHTIPDTSLIPASENDIVAFRNRLNEKGIIATIRASRGEDIMAACGLLAGKPS